MTKTCNIILHQKDQKEQRCLNYAFPLQVEEKKYTDTSIPDTDRTSLYDAVKFNELKKWLSLQLLLKNIPDPGMHLKVLQYLRYSYAYRAYNYFNVEYAEAIRLRLIKENKNHIPDYQPTMNEILAVMQSEGFYPNCDAAKMKLIVKELEQKIKSRNHPGNNSVKSYDETKVNELPFKPYFKKLGVTTANNAASPEDYLNHNYASAQKIEPLLHIRECEDIGCSINPHKSPFIKLISDNARMKIVEAILDQHRDEKETLRYCGFASGLLRRDLEIIKELIVTKKEKI